LLTAALGIADCGWSRKTLKMNAHAIKGSKLRGTAGRARDVPSVSTVLRGASPLHAPWTAVPPVLLPPRPAPFARRVAPHAASTAEAPRSRYNIHSKPFVKYNFAKPSLTVSYFLISDKSAPMALSEIGLVGLAVMGQVRYHNNAFRPLQ
jgi:hypothetical protein